MAGNIKGIMIEIGGDTTKLEKALSGVNKKSRDLKTELNQVQKLLKLDPTNITLLAQEQEVLKESIHETSKKLEVLKEAEKQAIEQFQRGEIAEDALRALQREVIKTENEINRFKSQLDDACEELEDASEDLEDVGEKAEQSGEGFTVMRGAMADLVADGISKVLDGLKNAISGLIGISEATREYRESLSKLNTAFLNSGHTAEQATNVYKELYSVFGEEDRAVEAAQQIANIAKSQEDMTRMTEIATGAWAKWGDSLATESLMEAISHTSKLGEVQGTLSDALEWCGISIEDFNKNLSKKNSEEERTEFILTELEKLYSNSADLYRKNNKSIMEARRETSDYNDVLADLGEELEPINTELIGMRTELLKGLTPTIKRKVVPAFKDFTDELKKSGAIEDLSDLIGDVAKKALPMMADGLKFVIKYFREIITVVAATVVAFKTMSIINTVTTAIKGATSAMGAFNAIMASNPITAIVSVIGVAAMGYIAFSSSVDDSSDALKRFGEEGVAAMERTEELAEQARETKERVDELSGALTAEAEHTVKLAEELLGLADEKGRVQEADRTRAQFIINELNDALGKEYSMVDGVIQKYGELESSIYDTINAKTANALLETKNEEYIEAIQNEGEAIATMRQNYESLEIQTKKTEEARRQYAIIQEKYNTAQAEANDQALDGLFKTLEEKELNMKKEEELLAEVDAKYQESAAVVAKYEDDKRQYTQASMLVLEGNYQGAIDILQNQGQAYFDYAENVSEATKQAVDALYEEAIQAGIKASETKKNFEDGVDGYTENMVKEAEDGYNAALEKWADAYIDANEIGKNLGEGLAEGLEGERKRLIEKATNIINDITEAMKTTGIIRSPSRKTMEIGEFLGDGLELGLENKTEDIVSRAESQIGSVLKAYSFGITKPMLAGTIGRDFAKLGEITGFQANGVESTKSMISGIGDMVNGKSIGSPMVTMVKNASTGTATIGGFTQNNNYYSPKALDPSESARLTKNATRNMVLQLQRG